MQDMVSPTLPIPMKGEPFSRLVKRRPVSSTWVFPDLVATKLPWLSHSRPSNAGEVTILPFTDPFSGTLAEAGSGTGILISGRAQGSQDKA